MMASLQSRIYGLILLLCISLPCFSQWSDGPFMSIGLQAGAPVNGELKGYQWAAGGVGKFALPLGVKDYITLSMNAISVNGTIYGKKRKERDILSAMMGYRYDFRQEESYSYFYMEPQIGWSFIGTDYNSFCYMPSVGYSLNGKIDFAAWYYVTTSNLKMAKVGAAGINIAYNFHFARKAAD